MVFRASLSPTGFPHIGDHAALFARSRATQSAFIPRRTPTSSADPEAVQAMDGMRWLGLGRRASSQMQRMRATAKSSKMLADGTASLLRLTKLEPMQAEQRRAA